MSTPFGIPTNAPNLPPGESEMVSKAQPMSEQNEGRVSDERLAEMLAGLDGVTPGPWDVKTHEEWNEGFDFFGGPDKAFVFRADVEPEDAAHIANCDPDTIRSLLTELQTLRASSRGEGEKK